MNKNQMAPKRETVAEIQWLGYCLGRFFQFFTVLALGICLYLLMYGNYAPDGIKMLIFLNVAFFFKGIFFVLIFLYRDYLKGKPSIIKMLPMILSSIFRFVYATIEFYASGYQNYGAIVNSVLFESAVLGLTYYMYFGDEETSSSFRKSLKPYKYV